jgi:hypothetical protein
LSNDTNDCNCIEHFCCGYEAGIALEQHKLDNPEIRLTFHELNAIGAGARDVKFEGNHAVVVYHLPQVALFSGTRTWMLGLEILTTFCGVNITRVKFQPTEDIETYEYGLVEE